MAFFILLASYGNLSAEHVFLKDGSIVRCKVLDETPELYTVHVKGGGKKVFLKKNVMRVLYTKLYLGRVYIYKTDGSILEAHIVEEDQDNYTVRKDLKKPKEFMIRRADVLFVSRDKNAGPRGKVPYGTTTAGNGFLAYTGLTRYLALTARAGFLVPVGRLARLYDYGGGGALSISVDNIFYRGFGMGVESGYFYLHGRTERSTYSSMVPFMADMTYRFTIGSFFAIEPKIGLGGSYNTANMAQPVVIYFKPRYTTRGTVEFMFSGGARFSFIISKPVFMGIEAAYCGIVEKTRVMSFLTAHVCLGVRL